MFEKRFVVFSFRSNWELFSESKGLNLKDAFGVKDGDIYQASLSQLKRYSDYIYQMEAAERAKVSWITKEEANKVAQSDVAGAMQKLVEEGHFLLGEVSVAMEKVGYKTLSKRLK